MDIGPNGYNWTKRVYWVQTRWVLDEMGLDEMTIYHTTALIMLYVINYYCNTYEYKNDCIKWGHLETVLKWSPTTTKGLNFVVVK